MRGGRVREADLAESVARVRALHATQSERPVAASPEPGLEAARRAIRVVGAPLPILARAHVATCHPQENIAAGVVPWGIVEPLRMLDPSITASELCEHSDVAD